MHGANRSLFIYRIGIHAEVFTNMVRIPEPLWDVLAQNRDRASVATSWYADNPDTHARITGRRTYERIMASISRAIAGNVPIRAAVIQLDGFGQDTNAAIGVLQDLGVPGDRIRIDKVRRIGRAGQASEPAENELCGRCGVTTAAVLPNGTVTPCPMSWWLAVGDIRDRPLAELLGNPMEHVACVIPRASEIPGTECPPDCGPNCSPMDGCVPWAVCSP